MEPTTTPVTPYQRLNTEHAQREQGLRPDTFESFVGQPKTVERLKVMTQAARIRGDALGHILLSGPPGLGKTTLAHLLGHAMGTQVRVTAGPVLEKPADLAGILTNLERGDVLFIDEIHRLSRTVEEYLYTAMEDFCLDIMIDQGPNARSVRLSLPPFCLVGATTRTGMLTAPLRSRFTLQTRLEHYSTEDLVSIALRTCKLLNLEADTEGAAEVAKRARGTPRILNNLLYFCRDYAQQQGATQLTRSVAHAALELLEIDARGLDAQDKRLLRTLAEHPKGGPIGLKTLAVAIGEPEHTVEDVHEPFLILGGYLHRTPQGRVITQRGLEALGR